MPRSDHLFPTTVIENLLRSQCLRDAVLDRKAGRLDAGEAAAILDSAGESALLLEERASLHKITDG